MNSLFQCHFQNLSGYLNYEKVLQHNPRIDCTKHRVFRKNEKEGTNIDFFGENMMNKHEIFAKKTNIDVPGKQDWLPTQPKALEASERHSLKNL